MDVVSVLVALAKGLAILFVAFMLVSVAGMIVYMILDGFWIPTIRDIREWWRNRGETK